MLTPTRADPYDELVDRYRQWPDYPVNSIRPGAPSYRLQGHRGFLAMSEDQLFDSESEELTFLDFYDGCERYQYNIVTTSDEINRHILNGQADPLCRHVFITANSSRGPLKCSRESLCKILSYHQTHAYFVDCISTFGATEDPLDYSLVSMYSDDTLHLAEERLLHIPRLNRSGHDIQLSYILRSVEKSEQWEKDKLEGKWQWKIRQMAVHHQFDVKTGRALWITIKANGLMEDRVKSLPWTCSQDAGGRVDAAEQFVATLRTQLIFLMWSDDNWRHCINDIEEQIRDILNKAKTARIEDDQEPKDIPMTIAKKLSRRGSKGWNGEKDEGPPTSRNWTLHWLLHSPRRKAASAATQLLQKVDKRYRTPMRATSQSEQMSSEASPAPSVKLPVAAKRANDNDANSDSHARQLRNLSVLGKFTFDQSQKLFDVGERLEEMKLVVTLNKQALRDIRELYNELSTREDMCKNIKAKCRGEVARFSREVGRIEKNLEIRKTQIESLLSWLREGKSLFDGIYQYRSVQIDRIFATDSHVQAQRMEKIAIRTEQETVLMHTITLVTLIFLPGTFVAVSLVDPFPRRTRTGSRDLTTAQTFFQSGLIEWNPETEHAIATERVMAFNERGFGLFVKICVPLMIAAMGLWWLVWICGRRKVREKNADELV